MQVLDGIYQLITPFPKFTREEARKIRSEIRERRPATRGLPYVLPYMIKAGNDVALVDCGWNTADAYAALDEGMREHGTEPAALQRLFVTHVHPDHFGMAGKLKQVSSCSIVMHELDVEVIGTRYHAPRPLVDQQAKFMQANGVPRLESPPMAEGSMDMLDKVAAVIPDTQVRGDEIFRIGHFEFQVIWTPGHTPGHICLYEPNYKILMTGDHILPTITPNISVHAQSHGSPLGDYMRSLHILTSLDVDYMLPAHEYDTRDLMKRIQEIEDHHISRLDEMYLSIDSGGSTAWDVAGRVRWATGLMADFDPFQQRAAVGETLAHLEYMFEIGRLSKVMRDGVQYWLRV